LDAATTPGAVLLTWNFPVGATRFEVKRAAQSGGPYMTLASPVTSSYADSAVVAGTVYYYVITAKNDTGASWNSPELVSASDLTVDNTDIPAVTVAGAWSPSTGTPGYLGTNYVHDGNTGKGTKSFSFKPGVPSTRNYRVYARWPAETNRATNVPVDIVTSSGAVTTVTINQQTNSNKWTLLGTYTLAPANVEVKFRNAGTNGYVVADGVRVIPVPVE
jgi:hypothetical protein